jgi:tetratricopeptide (TPR) repeat protein
MNNHELHLEESFTSWLAACDEMLATGLKPSTLEDVGLQPELQHRLRRGVACLERLQELWPARAGDVFPESELAADAPLLTRLGKFELRRELGRGGFGVVYLARDTQLDREVALKIPRLDVLLSSDLRNRFHQEALAAARLDHPLIVPVFEAGAVGIVSFIASAYCPGVTLAAWLKDHPEPMPCPAAARLVADLADAVQHAHSRGVIHRDLKPGNILLQIAERRPQISEAHSAQSAFRNSQSAIPRITDFGLAKFAWAEGQDATMTGIIAGTAGYMSPEQAAGKTKEVGTAADVYALGAILFELLTRQPPFQGEALLATLEQVRTAEPTPPRRLRPEISRDLETICLKCLQKDPTRRYASATELRDDLRRFVDGEPIQARPAGVFERAWKWARRHPAWAMGSGLAALALVIAAVKLDQDRREAMRQRQALRAALRELVAGADLLLPRQSQFDTRPGLPPEKLVNLQRLYEELETAPENAHDPALRHELARAARLIGEIHRRLGDAAAAQSAHERAVGLLEELIREYPQQRAYQVDLAVTLCMHADQTRDPIVRLRLLNRAAEVVRSLADAHPDQPTFQREWERIKKLTE